MINKKKFTLKGSIILIIVAIILTISQITYSKVRVNVDGSVNINFGKSRNENGRDRRNDYWDNNYYDDYSIGDITDSQYNMRPFILNGKGYSVLKNNGRLYILQVEFRNGNVNRAEKETIYNARVFSSNCLAIDGDSNYCLTITSKGQPALWDRQLGRIRYTGRWLKTNYGYDYYDNNYYDSNQSWFEW